MQPPSPPVEPSRPPTPAPDAVATAPEASPPESSTPANRPSLRELTGADEPQNSAPPAEQRAERPSPPPVPDPSPADRRADRTPVQPGAARSMARLMAEIEAGKTLGGRPAARDERQASLPPDERPRRPQSLDLDGDEFADCERCPVMSVVTATDFLGQAPRAARPRGRSLAVSKFEVTVAEWVACAREGACRGFREHNTGNPQRPVVNVTREDASEYAAWLSQKTGQSYRLMKVGGWSERSGEPPAPRRETAPYARRDDADEACAGGDWRWLDDPECAKRYRRQERSREDAASARQSEASSGFRVARTLGPGG